MAQKKVRESGFRKEPEQAPRVVYETRLRDQATKIIATPRAGQFRLWDQ